MIHIQRRENSKGNWWVNTTVDGEDVCFEEEMLGDAEKEMMAFLFHRGYSNKDVVWEEPKRYETTGHFIPKPIERPWLDKGMV